MQHYLTLQQMKFKDHFEYYFVNNLPIRWVSNGVEYMRVGILFYYKVIAQTLVMTTKTI